MIKLVVKGKSLFRYSCRDGLFDSLGIQPYAHQILAREFLLGGGKGTKILFNTCGTGLGKTYSVVVPLLEGGDAYSIFIYPTNALIEDQYQTILSVLRKTELSDNIVLKVTALELSKYAKKIGIDRREILEDFLEATYSNQRILVTNPDLFYISLSFRFAKRFAKEIAIATLQRFNTIIFDEFHLYNWKQLSNILFFLKMFSEFNEDATFIFLSATPNQELKNEIFRIFKNAKIQSVGENDQLNIRGEEFKALADTYLQIERYDNILSWFERNMDFLRNFIQKNRDVLDNDPDSKIVIILNSVYMAQQVKKLLEDKLNDLDITIGAWHGLNKYTRFIEKDRKVIIGTSAIEVGIDFKAILLIFEADNASSFIQRFGRVGRIAGKPEWANFEFNAIALVPNYVYNYLQRVFKGKREITRNELYDHVYRAFEDYTKFERYKDIYAPIEHYGIANEYIKSTYDLKDRALFQEYLENILLEVHNDIKLQEVRNKFEELSKIEGLLDELYQFRGNLFNIPIFDKRLADKGDFPFAIYNLFYVLRHFNFEILNFNEFNSLLEAYTNFKEAYNLFVFELNQILKHDKSIPFIKILSESNERVRYYFFNENDVIPGEVEIGQDFRILPYRRIYNQQKLTSLEKINKWVSKKELVYICFNEPTHLIRAKYKLSPYFQIFVFRGYSPVYDIRDGTIAFGLNAFLLASQIIS